MKIYNTQPEWHCNTLVKQPIRLRAHDVADNVDDRDVQGLTATQLGSSAIKASVERAGIEADQVEE